MKTYAIYVSDDNGWFEGCPDYKTVFFGHGEGYVGGGVFAENKGVSPEAISFAQAHRGGCLVITGYRAALARQRQLDCTGDWVAPREVNPDGQETRPQYAMRAI